MIPVHTPLRIGITGGIGCGKSFICRMLNEATKWPVYSCDDRAKALMNEDQQLRESLTHLVGENAYTLSEGKWAINRTAIAQFLFASADNAAAINAIVHPCVMQDFEAWAQRQTTPVVIMESAILYESGFNAIVDKTVAVTASLNTRIARVQQRDKATEEQVRQRILRQMNQDELIRRSDFIVANETTPDIPLLITQIKQSIHT